MDLARRCAQSLRVVLALTFTLLLVLQLLSFPGMFAHMAREHPHDAWLRWPLTALAATVILCGQVVVVCTWKLLSLVRTDRIFTTAADRWVNGIIAAVTVAWCLLAGAFVLAGATADDPGGPVVLLLVLLLTSAVALLMPVLRALLRQATQMRTCLDPTR